MDSRRYLLLFLLSLLERRGDRLAFSTAAATAFVPTSIPLRPSTTLYGISEWRDFVTAPTDALEGAAPKKVGVVEVLPKEVCILPFPYQEVLLQGETKQLRLYEDRFIQLFDDCMENHYGVVAMGLMANNMGLVQSVPLAEVEAYNRMPGFGIFVTIRVVARATLVHIVQEAPYIKAICTELTDQVPSSGLEEANLVASNIENYMLLLSSMEHRLETAKSEQGVEDPNDVDLVMKQRILIAKLEDTYYDENVNNDDSDEDDDDDDDDADPSVTATSIDRRKRFRRAYEVALSTDTQGYQTTVSQTSSSSSSSPTAATTTASATADRSTRELTAMSWAAFGTELLLEEDAAARIQALDCNDLVERLQLAAKVLRVKEAKLRARMEKAGLKCGDRQQQQDEGDSGADQGNGEKNSK